MQISFCAIYFRGTSVTGPVTSFQC